MDFKCEYCSKEFKRSHKSRFCSLICFGRWQSINKRGQDNPNWKGKIKECLYCHKKYKNYNHKNKFCSRLCYMKWKVKTKMQKGKKHPGWKGGKLRRECKCCGKVRYLFPSQTKRFKKAGKFYNQGRFCSLRCKGLYMFVHNRGGRKETDIEKIMRKELEKENIDYQAQVLIEGIRCVDFLLFQRFIIECDGTFWHNLPGCKAKDEKRDKILEGRGYKIFRFSDKDIKNNVGGCLSQVADRIGGPGKEGGKV